MRCRSSPRQTWDIARRLSAAGWQFRANTCVERRSQCTGRGEPGGKTAGLSSHFPPPCTSRSPASTAQNALPTWQYNRTSATRLRAPSPAGAWRTAICCAVRAVWARPRSRACSLWRSIATTRRMTASRVACVRAASASGRGVRASMSSRSMRRRIAASTMRGICGSARCTRRRVTITTRSTSSTKRTCSRARRGMRSSRCSRSRRRASCSCSRLRSRRRSHRPPRRC